MCGTWALYIRHGRQRGLFVCLNKTRDANGRLVVPDMMKALMPDRKCSVARCELSTKRQETITQDIPTTNDQYLAEKKRNLLPVLLKS